MSRDRISLDTIAGFFDEVAQALLDPFNWNPNPDLPHGQQRVYTIKDFFKVRHHGRTCIYFTDELDVCKAHFHNIFADCLLYVAQCDNIYEKLKIIANPDKYILTGEIDNTANNESTSSQRSNSTQNSSNDRDSKYGGFRGELDSTQLSTGLDKTRRLVETSQIINKSTEKIMDYLIPSSRQVSHTVNIEKQHDTGNVVNTGTTEFSNKGNSTRKMIHKKGAAALHEIQALHTRLKQIRAEFLECFNPLFYI